MITGRPVFGGKLTIELRVTKLSVRAWLAAGGLFVSACAGSGSAPAHAGAAFASTGPGSLCASFTRALCAYQVQCQGVPYCSLDHCLAENDCAGFSRLARALDAGAVAYAPAAGAACFAAFGNDPCHAGLLPPTPDVFDVLGQCPGALVPGLGSGDVCLSGTECAAGLRCKNAGRYCPGVCAPFATAGQSCAGGAPCADGLRCNARDVCQANGSAGSSCADYSDCGPDLHLWCDVQTGVCMPGGAPGVGCGVTAAGLTACAAGLWCDAVSNQAGGVCRTPGAAGAACNDLGGCQPGLHCTGAQTSGGSPTLGQCAPPADVGGTCETSGDCVAGLVCNGGSCGPRFDVGLRCRSDSTCQAGLTCATEKCLPARCPGQPCLDGSSACVLSVCKSGRCQDRAKLGGVCGVGGDCTSGACVAGRCVDASPCAL
jgi:hypothetical protein